MSQPVARVIELTEYQTQRLAATDLPQEIGVLLWEQYGAQVAVEFPTRKTDYQWQLTAQGWIGYIPLTPELGIRLLPKVDLGNVFRMLEYAFRLKHVWFFNALVDCKSLEDFFEQLASLLAKRILDRARRGFYRAYLGHSDQLPYIRGRMDIGQVARSSWDPRIYCHYEEHTADIEENQILTWTLWRIAQSGNCSERVLPTVRRAFRSLQGLTTLEPVLPERCVGRLYNRLNDDYQPLHALSRFFLEQRGPSHHIGDRQVMPFLVDMASLFELFVAEWLKQHLPPEWMLKTQEHVPLGENKDFNYRIDLVLYNAASGQAHAVLDTKYKAPERPAENDIQQAQSYAHTKGCREAVLIYPVALARPLAVTIRDIHIRSLVFALDGDIEEAGQVFLDALMQQGVVV